MPTLDLAPLLILAGLVVVAFFVGMPAAEYFTQPLSGQTRGRVFVFAYVAILLGYGQLHLLSFFAMELLGQGTNTVALPVTLLSSLGTLIFLVRDKGRTWSLLKSETGSLALLLILLLLATVHVMLPVVLGRWEMAYATGDDASRWYMVVSYFRTHPFDFIQLTKETLRWQMVERPLQNISGAMIAALFQTKASYAYSVSAASSLVMAAAGFCLVFEGLFGTATQRSRYFLWTVAALFFGLFGSFANIFYTGRATHHFSMYAVIAALGFVAIEDSGLRRFWWYCFWSVVLAYVYTIRYSGNFIATSFAMLLFQMLAGQITGRAFMRNIAGMGAALLVTLIAAYEELRLIIGMMKGPSSGFLFLQKTPNYGADGTFLDRLLKWSGFLGTYESHEQLSGPVQAGLIILITLVCAGALFQMVKYYKRAPAYSGLVIFNFVSAGALFLNHNFFVVWKLALYWPIYILLGYLGFALNLQERPRWVPRLAGMGLLIVIVGYFCLTTRQFSFHFSLADVRYTKVDRVTNEMLQTVARDGERHLGTSRSIFGYDFSTERHLLLREIFRDYAWQPIRGTELNFENDMSSAVPTVMDQYHYGYLLYAQTYPAEPIDFSGNARALIYDHPPFRVFSAHSSLLEFRDGFEMRAYGAYDAIRRYYPYGEMLTREKGTLVFANNGGHDWLEIKIRVCRKSASSEAEKAFSLITDQASIQPTKSFQPPQPDFTDCVIRLAGLEQIRLLKITVGQNAPGAQIIVTSSQWGYR